MSAAASVHPQPHAVCQSTIPPRHRVRLIRQLEMLSRHCVQYLRLLPDHAHGVLGLAARQSAHLLPQGNRAGRQSKAFFRFHGVEGVGGRGLGQWRIG